MTGEVQVRILVNLPLYFFNVAPFRPCLRVRKCCAFGEAYVSQSVCKIYQNT